MRRKSLARFALFGAVGFGIGGAIASTVINVMDAGVFLTPIAGAVGGAFLGWPLRDRRKLIALTLLGFPGMLLGLIVALALGGFVNYSRLVIGLSFGAVLGASLGVAFLDLRRIRVLAGAMGFGTGVPVGDFLDNLKNDFGGASFVVIAGIIGGAALGAALGYFEGRGPARRRVA